MFQQIIGINCKISQLWVQNKHVVSNETDPSDFTDEKKRMVSIWTLISTAIPMLFCIHQHIHRLQDQCNSGDIQDGTGCTRVLHPVVPAPCVPIHGTEHLPAIVERTGAKRQPATHSSRSAPADNPATHHKNAHRGKAQRVSDDNARTGQLVGPSNHVDRSPDDSELLCDLIPDKRGNSSNIILVRNMIAHQHLSVV